MVFLSGLNPLKNDRIIFFCKPWPKEVRPGFPGGSAQYGGRFEADKTLILRKVSLTVFSPSVKFSLKTVDDTLIKLSISRFDEASA